jgi:hypothetical protein
MTKYDNETLVPIPPSLTPDEQEHVLITQDESIFHTNEYQRCSWLCGDEQPLKRKGNGRAIHVSDFICKTTGRLALSEEQLAQQATLPPDQQLKVMDA